MACSVVMTATSSLTGKTTKTLMVSHRVWCSAAECQAAFNPETSEQDFPLHWAAFHGHLIRTKELTNADTIDGLDTHGNTPLHVAIMRGHNEIVDYLLEQGATLKLKNCDGWLALDEAISYGDRNIIAAVLKRHRAQQIEGIISRQKELLERLQQLNDFYLELKWEFHTWVPLLSRLLPSDVCRIHKRGTKIRMDCTLMDFSEMSWQRGDISFLYNGEDQRDPNNILVYVMDHQKKQYNRIRLLDNGMEAELEDQVDFLQSRPIVYANMSTKPIKVSRAQSGILFFRSDKKETVGEYETKVYDITDLILVSRRRTEHLSAEDKQQHEQLQKKIESGDLSTEDLELSSDSDHTSGSRRDSLPPPPLSEINWARYISSFHTPEIRRAAHIGRALEYKEDKKHYKASISVADNCPLDISKLMDVLEAIAPYKHFQKLRNFVSLRLLPEQGFPVKLNVPIFPTVTAIVTLEKYKSMQCSDSTFLVPLNYNKFVPNVKK